MTAGTPPSRSSTASGRSHVKDGRTVRCYSRRGLDLLRHRGLAWLKTIPWPMEAAVLDGEVFAGNGCDGIDSVFAARDREGGATAVAVFDILRLDGASVMAKRWEERRNRLEELFRSIEGNRVQLVPVADDAKALWDAWVEGWGGEGSFSKTGARSTAPASARRRG
jgi:ATP-dependent DNA ligase